MAKKRRTVARVPESGSGLVGCSPCCRAGMATVAMPRGAAIRASCLPWLRPDPSPCPKRMVAWGAVPAPASGSQMVTGTR